MENYSFSLQNQPSELMITSEVLVLSDRIRSVDPGEVLKSGIPSGPYVADITEKDELEEEEMEGAFEDSPSTGDLMVMKIPEKKLKLSKEERELIRMMNVKIKKDFVYLERVNGKMVNILEGLELHTEVFNPIEQKKIVDLVCELQEKGQKGELKRAFTAQGKGRSAIQFGCCFNFRTDKAGNPPGILKQKTVEPLPPLFKLIVKRLVKWHILPPTCVPDCCVVNIYEKGDSIPPHVDNHDFLRPFCTVSFLSECNILFGSDLKAKDSGEYSDSYSIPLPIGSVLVINGNGADVAKHCVPDVPTKRISITFRKMEESKRPVWFTPEPDLQGIQPLPYVVKPPGSADDRIY